MWNWDLVQAVLPKLLLGFRLTVLATALSFLLALVLGLVWELMRRVPGRVPRLMAQAVIDFVRNTPLLVQLYVLYYTLPQFGLVMPALLSGVIGLGLHYSTYIAEIYRSGISAIPRGQWEAASVLGFRRQDIWLRIILPQAVPPLIPALGNRLIALFKETPLLAAITVPEMLLAAREFGDAKFSYVEAYTGVGVLFLLVSLLATGFVMLLERRYSNGQLQFI